MPNRYQREIEEILNRMEESDPQKGSSARIRPFRRPKPQRPRGLSAPHIPIVELLLLLAIALVLIGSGLAFYDGGATPVSGTIGAVGILLFVVALVVGWRDRFRPSSPRWRGTALDNTPDRPGPFGDLAARIRIWQMRQRYRRGQRQQGHLDD
jgi:hypothetical protein